MKTLLLIFVCLFIWSCQPDTGQDQQAEDTATNTEDSLPPSQIDSPKKEDVPTPAAASELETAALSFHSWYLTHINNFESEVPTDAFVVEGENGKCKLEMEPYFKELRKLGTISEAFIQAEKNRLAPCAEEMAQTDWEDYMLGNVCDMLQYFYWIDSQETMEFVELDKMALAGDSAVAQLRFYDVFKGEKKYWEDLQAEVLLASEDSIWRIISITHHSN